MRAPSPLVLLVVIFGACGSGEHVDVGPGDPDCPEVIVDSGGGIEEPPDGEALCPPGDCNYQTAEGCQAEEACLPMPRGDTLEIEPTCVAAGSGRAGDSCEDGAVPSDCAPGYFCAGGTCRQLCCGNDWSACDGQTSCFRPLLIRLESEQESVDVPAGVSLCFPTGTCDVLDPDSCDGEPRRTCKIVDPTGAVACVRAGDGVVGDPCDAPEICGPGLSCVGETCVRLCRAEACGEPSCPEEEGVCVHLDRHPPGVGECSFAPVPS